MNSRRAAWSSIQQLSSRSLVDGGIVVLGLVEEGGIVDVQVCGVLWYWMEIIKSEKRGDYGYVCCVCTMVLLAVAR